MGILSFQTDKCRISVLPIIETSGTSYYKYIYRLSTIIIVQSLNFSFIA